MNARLLIVDDDANLLAAFQRNLRKQFSFDTALSGAEALQLLETKGPYAVVLADMNMPGMKGIELLERVRQRAPDTVRMMLTGNADQQTAVDAVNRGEVFRFLNKPCPPETLVPALEAALRAYELLRIERELLEGTLAGSVKVLVDVLGMISPHALGRGQRLRDSMARFARFVGTGPLWELDLAALLVNIGYTVVPYNVLRKLGSGLELLPEEQHIVERTPRIGHDLLIEIPRLKPVARAVLYQSARFDGSGFPGDGLAGESLPVASRMIKILSDRLDLEDDGVVKRRAFEAMNARTGYYDPKLLEKCFECFGDFLANTLSSDRPVHQLPLHSAQAGDVVVSDIATRSGFTLVRAGTVLTAMVIARLENFLQLGELQEPLLVQRPTPEEAQRAAAAPQLTPAGS
ncbi:MAG: response regulator [Opitutae bacterium]|nr:response regulator [Opitutae bacterium]